MERLLDDDIDEIVVSQGVWSIRWSREGVCNLVGLASDVPDVAGKLADEKQVTYCLQGPGGGGVSLRDGAGQGLVVGVENQLPALDSVGTSGPPRPRPRASGRRSNTGTRGL